MVLLYVDICKTLQYIVFAAVALAIRATPWLKIAKVTQQFFVTFS